MSDSDDMRKAFGLPLLVGAFALVTIGLLIALQPRGVGPVRYALVQFPAKGYEATGRVYPNQGSCERAALTEIQNGTPGAISCAPVTEMKR